MLTECVWQAMYDGHRFFRQRFGFDGNVGFDYQTRSKSLHSGRHISKDSDICLCEDCQHFFGLVHTADLAAAAA